MGLRRHVNRDFAAADGEGGDINGRHEYLMLRAGNGVLETGEPLTPYECLKFIAGLDPGLEHVAYFFDYDVTMMLRDLPPHAIRALLDRDGRIVREDRPPAPVHWNGFEFDYLPHKEFRVRRQPRQGERVPWVIISDTGSFFQSSFVTSIEKWDIGTPEEREAVGIGKSQRAVFGAVSQDTRDYNALECRMLEELLTAFRDTCKSVGYVPRRWQGPGNIASVMLQHHGIPRLEELAIPDEVLQYAQAAYYGGRFETTAMGHVPGPVYQSDINSAYPWACTQLPCLKHSSWHRTSVLRGMGVYQVRFQHPAGFLCHLPIRRQDGSIHYPRMGSGWYWYPEIQAAINAGAKIAVLSGYFLSQGCDCRPFSWVEDVYRMRVKLGKQAKGMVLKLCLNSLYGKQAQSIGAAPYANPIYAGLITAFTRAKLTDAYAENPNAVLMLATDGLFTSEPLGMTDSKVLGEWDVKTHEDGMFIIQPGLYFAGDQKPKTRGVPMGKVLERANDFRRVWEESFWASGETLPQGSTGRNRGPDYPEVTLSLRNFIGLRLAYAWNKPELAGQWIDVQKTVSFDWSTKRKPNKTRRDGKGIVRTFPYDGDIGKRGATTPYSKTIGGNVARGLQRLEFEDVPDWAATLRGEN